MFFGSFAYSKAVISTNQGSSSLFVLRRLIGCVVVDIHGHANEVRVGSRAGRAGCGC
jgi:hypothetical protein